MANYAFLDSNNIVVEVITGIDETELIEGKDPETWYGELRGQRCLRTSRSGSFRRNYAGIGFSYDEELDAFIPPKPYGHNSWYLDEQTANWVPPVPYPEAEEESNETYVWDEDSQQWTLYSL